MQEKYHRFLDSFVPDAHKSDDEALLKARLLINSCFLVILQTVAFDLMYLWLELWIGIIICTTTSLTAVFLLYNFRKNGNFQFAGNFYAFCALIVLGFFTLWLDGINGPVVAWMVLVPLSAFFYSEFKHGVFWTAVSGLWIIGLYFYYKNGWELFPPIETDQMPLVNIFLTIGLMCYLVFLITFFEKGKAKVIEQLKGANRQITETSMQLKVSQLEIEGRNQEIHAQKALLENRNQEISAMNSDLEKLVAARTRHLETANEELDTFLYNSSHALRRPLARIMGLIDILKHETDTEEIEYFRDKIDYTARNMDDMLYKLLQVSEVEQSRLTVETMGVTRFLSEIKEELQPELKANKIHLDLEDPEDLQLATDSYLLRIALNNLLLNAIHYTSVVNDRKRKVRITVNSAEDRILIRVWDNGMGIQPEVLPNLFEMFFRGTEKSKGSGLGLYIVKKVVDRLKGSIWVQSEPDQFSLFILSLPRRLFADQDASGHAGNSNEASGWQTATGTDGPGDVLDGDLLRRK